MDEEFLHHLHGEHVQTARSGQPGPGLGPVQLSSPLSWGMILVTLFEKPMGYLQQDEPAVSSYHLWRKLSLS